MLSDLWLMSAATFRRLGKIDEAKGAIQQGEVKDENNPNVWVQVCLPPLLPLTKAPTDMPLCSLLCTTTRSDTPNTPSRHCKKRSSSTRTTYLPPSILRVYTSHRLLRAPLPPMPVNLRPRTLAILLTVPVNRTSTWLVGCLRRCPEDAGGTSRRYGTT